MEAASGTQNLELNKIKTTYQNKIYNKKNRWNLP